MKFDYQASVIVPVYNVEDYLEICLDSLVNQTIDKSKMEVLVINDGSPDNSWEICKRYSEKYDFIKAFSKENEGLSATRNFGIKHAKGKYLFFLDSDDYFTPPTVEKVTNYFDSVYDKVDMVAYNEVRYNQERILKPHFRFKMLKRQGVYDLEEYPYLTQTRVNVCVKNIGEDNVLFNTTPGFKLEDQEYCNRVLMPKMKMGYCPGGTYMYNKGNESSIMRIYFHAYYLFETSIKYFEELFANFSGKVPKYFQAMFINDINWRLSDDILYPYHYEGEERERAKRRIIDLLNRVDSDTILEHPMIEIYRSCYWLAKKENTSIEFIQDSEGLKLMIDGNEAYKQEDFVVIGHKPRVEGGVFKLTGFIKSPIFNFLNRDEYDVYAVENGEYKKLDTFVSVHSNYRAKIVTNIFPAFHYSCDIAENNKVSFAVRIRNQKYSSHFWFMQYSGFGKHCKTISRGGYMIKNKKNYLSIKPSSPDKTDRLDYLHTVPFLRHPHIAMLRLKSVKYRKQHRIWLYYDFYSVEKDNGYFQFANDLKHDDGIERYYVLTHEYEDLDSVFTPEQKKHLVKFGSQEHKLLFVCAERIFTAYYGLAPVNPFDSAKQKHLFFEDLMRMRTIYLQHGVLHAALRLNNSEERSQAEEIVVSSPFEIENYTQNYAYKEENLIPTGMARYDYIDKNHKPMDRILFAPSWRRYITTEIKASNWKVNTEKIMKSDYYKNFLAFLSNRELHRCLEEHGVYLDIKLHPILSSMTGLFDIDCDYVNMVHHDVDVADYKAFVTDFSSYVFDFAYLERPIRYFVPDYPQFKSGMNHYRDLDLPFDKAFGKMFTDPEKAAEHLAQMVSSDFRCEEIYAKRMADFYFKFDGNCAENLYKFVTEQDKKLSEAK